MIIHCMLAGKFYEFLLKKNFFLKFINILIIMINKNALFDKLIFACY